MGGPRGPRARRRRQQGFTLVELLIVVAMIGVMSTLAMVGYRKYLYSAQSSEAKNVIQMIRGAQEAYKAEMLQYLTVSTNLTTYYPNTSPNDVRYSWVYPSHTDYPNWKQLNVNPDAPVRFGYACIAGIAPTNAMVSLTEFHPAIVPPGLNSGTAWYEIQAKNDHNANSVYAVFASTSLSGEILSENETE
jgi:type IV pilus assembly protein PilA